MTEWLVQKKKKSVWGKKSGSNLITVGIRKKLNTKRPVKKKKHDIELGQGW